LSGQWLAEKFEIENATWAAILEVGASLDVAIKHDADAKLR
jgi:hypothetical protein